MALPLGLRNRLAELILDAFDDVSARETLGALVRFCGSEEGRLRPEDATRLLTLGWFERAGPDRLRLRGAHQMYRPALCGRVAAATSMVAEGAGGEAGGSQAGLLGRAARLADAGLYFEVHELLEPAWMRAEGLARVALQGLIQVAVAFHHAQQGNHPGARSLLAEGLAKLTAARGALPLDTEAWEQSLGGVRDALEAGQPPPPASPWPRPRTTSPTESAWRCS
ncbi:MAG TPA: DUF309 domain-containing protein [Methylomirabilota bacterium]|nr:DUF309 domain-containing protein [Methylomirabilota bacterium]